MAKVVIKRGRANPLWHGHPWVFSGAIEREVGSYAAGDIVDVEDSDGRLIGRGYANPRSQIRVRLVTFRDEPVDGALLRRRLAEAQGLRRLLGLPSAETTAYRLVSSEGDGLPGVTIDVYGDVAVVLFSTLGMKRVEDEVYAAVDELLRPRAIVEAAAGGVAQLEGFHAQNRIVRLADGPDEASIRRVACLENGIKLEVDPLGGQKSGMFLDQRDNRRRVAGVVANMVAAGRRPRVLDVYTYAGGFALAALRAGAAEATCVDSSARALERATQHAQLNGLGGLDTVESDAFRFLESATPRRYDVVILDPPKFARAKKDLEAAMKGYQRLNMLGLTAVAEDGILATASCSQNVDLESFERMLAAAARDAGRRVQVLEVASQAPDHPVTPAFAEGRYLKFLLCRVV
jgi:23S rRNA (cytosine1962-C5)-methyltransferase